MAKRPLKKNKSKNKKKSKEVLYLEKLIEYTVRCIDGRSEELDLLFTNQANKLRVQIKNLEQKQ